MAKHSIRVRSKNEYVIEVNDKGETISFDLTDTELMLKFDRALTKINQIQKEIEEKQKELNELKDEKTDSFMTMKEKEEYEMISKAYQDMRNAVDEFCGKGACQKIFGDTNYIEMFNDLFDQLMPHFEAMGMNADKMRKEIEEKYSDKEEDVL